MIVLPDHPFLAAHVERPENLVQGLVVAQLARNGQGRLRQRPMHGVADNGGPPRVQKVHVEAAHFVFVELEHQLLRVGELADHSRCDSFRSAQVLEFVPVRRRDRQHHPFLRFGNPDFGVRQPRVFQRRLVEPDLGSRLASHFTHGTRKAAGAAIGDRRVQLPVAGRENHVQQHFFGDGVADLHCSTRKRFAFMRELGRRKRGAVDAVTPSLAADGHDEIADSHLLRFFADGDHGDISAIDERIAQIAFVEKEGAIDRGNAHAVAVVADPRDDSAGHDARVQDAGRQLIVRDIWRSEAKDIGIADGPSPHSGPHRVANDAPQSRVGPAVGLERRGVVVRLDLDADVLLVVEFDDPRVVLKHAHAPVFAPQPPANFDRSGKHGFLEQIFELDFTLAVAIQHPPPQRLVRTVFAPGLGDRFEFGVGGFAVLFGKVAADRLHFGQAQVELPFAAETGQLVVFHAADGNSDQAKGVIRTDRQVRHAQRPPNDLLDGVVGQHFRSHAFEIGRVGIVVEPVFLTCPHGGNGMAQFQQGSLDAVGDVVGNAGLVEHVQKRFGPGRFRRRHFGFRIRRVRRREVMGLVGFDDGVDQEAGGDFLDRGGGDVPFDQKRSCRADVADGRDPQRLALALDAGRLAVGQVRRRVNFNFAKHI